MLPATRANVNVCPTLEVSGVIDGDTFDTPAGPTATAIPRPSPQLRSLMIAQGARYREVMETLGHSTIVITLNRYGHIFQEAQRETAKEMGQILTG